MLDPSYIRSIRDGIINGNIEANNQEALPDGLVGLYDRELFPSTMKYRERKETLHFFLVFAIAQKEISADFAASILGDEWFNLSDVDSSKEEKRLQRFNELIQLHSKRFSSAGGGKYRLYHERFRVYVLQKVSEKKIAQFNAKFIALCETALNSNLGKDIPEKESYALEFLTTHFYVGAMQGEKECLNKEQAAELKKYAYNQQFWERQIIASKGFEWSKKMLDQMMRWASKFNEDEEVIECASNKVDLYHQEQNDAPRIVQLVADGDIETALERIEKFGGKDKEGVQRMFTLYMLCLIELTLLDSKDKDHAKTSIEKILTHFDENIPANQPDLINWNDFFPSYLMFQLACELAEFGFKYLMFYERTDNWDIEWLSRKSPYSDSDFDVLLQCIGMIPHRFNAQLDIIIELAKQGKYDVARDIANDIEDVLVRDNSLSEISIELAKQGNYDVARDIANDIEDVLVRDNSLNKISIELAKQGKYDMARAFANDIEDVLVRDNSLSEISIELAKQRDPQDFLNCIRSFDNYKRVNEFSDYIFKKFESGNHQLAFSLIPELDRYLLELLEHDYSIHILLYCRVVHKLSIQLAREGKVAYAKRYAEKLKSFDEYYFADAITEIAIVIAQNNVVEAKSYINKINGIYYKALANQNITREPSITSAILLNEFNHDSARMDYIFKQVVFLNNRIDDELKKLMFRTYNSIHNYDQKIFMSHLSNYLSSLTNDNVIASFQKIQFNDEYANTANGALNRDMQFNLMKHIMEKRWFDQPYSMFSFIYHYFSAIDPTRHVPNGRSHIEDMGIPPDLLERYLIEVPTQLYIVDYYCIGVIIARDGTIELLFNLLTYCREEQNKYYLLLGFCNTARNLSTQDLAKCIKISYDFPIILKILLDNRA